MVPNKIWVMEKWQGDFEWLRIRHFLKDLVGQERLPDLNNILLLIGIRELGQIKEEWTKEEKRDLMNIAACALMEREGYYRFHALDDEGWPHYEALRPFDVKGVEEQEKWMKDQIIQYFNENVFSDESQID